MTKNWIKITAEKKNLIFFWSKTVIYLSLGLHKVCPGYRRSLQLTKEAIQHFKTWIFSTFVGHFCPPGSGSGFKLRIRIQWSDWIRIQYGSGYGSGSETLVQRPFWDWKSGNWVLVNFGKFPCSWIQIRITNTDPDQREPNSIESTRLHVFFWSYSEVFQIFGSGNHACWMWIWMRIRPCQKKKLADFAGDTKTVRYRVQDRVKYEFRWSGFVSQKYGSGLGSESSKNSKKRPEVKLSTCSVQQCWTLDKLTS